MQIHDDLWRKAQCSRRNGLGFRRLQQQVIAVDIQAAGCGTDKIFCAIGVGSWQDQDIHSLQQIALCRDEPLRQCQRRLTTRRFVAMLLPQDQNGRSIRLKARRGRQQQQRYVASLLRFSDGLHTQPVVALRGEQARIRQHFFVACEVLPARCQTGGCVKHPRI